MEEKTNPASYNPTIEMRITKLILGLNSLFVVMATMELYEILKQMVNESRWGAASGHLVFIVIVVFLLYGGFLYLFCRLGYLKRRLSHEPAADSELDLLFQASAPSLTVLVPSYKEEERVVFLTLLSAALQDYPKKRVVLLIDDPPSPKTDEDRQALEITRQIPHRIQSILAIPRKRYTLAQWRFHKRLHAKEFDQAEEIKILTSLYKEAADWFLLKASEHSIIDHTDKLFIDKTLKMQADLLLSQAEDLGKKVEGCTDISSEIAKKIILRGYFRLSSLFTVEMKSFERKLYENCSHESNKAMNLNSYIGLVGKSFCETKKEGKIFLEEVRTGKPDLKIPDTDYFITLDADSIILPCYALRLIHHLEKPENSKIAVAQTPYSAFPDSPGLLERIAGATTDIQYIIHQGFTRHNATYWVGANALLRKSALIDISQEVEERGYKVKQYIHDRTVIEDTESSIDLVDKGWSLYNYPERLAYSATPPDFGSLLIQRRRWANGGLIILPKLLRYLARGPFQWSKMGEAFMRLHYLISIAAVNMGLLIVIAFPFTENVKSLWLPFCALPYFIAYSRDLISMGYKKLDILRVYALNLLLIPVNMGGVLKSLEQGWSKKKIPFGRTPKILGRTAIAPVYIWATYILIGYWGIRAGWDFIDGHVFHGIFALANTSMLTWGVTKFIGWRASMEDLGLLGSFDKASEKESFSEIPIPIEEQPLKKAS